VKTQGEVRYLKCNSGYRSNMRQRRKGKNSDKSGRSKMKVITRGHTKEDEFSLITILVHDKDTFQPNSPNGKVSNWQCARHCIDDF